MRDIVPEAAELSEAQRNLTSDWFMRDRRALFFLDEDREIRLMNRLARRLLDAGQFFRLESRTLHAVSRQDHEEFEAAIERCLTGGERGWGLLHPDGGGTGVGVYALIPAPGEKDGTRSLLVSFLPPLVVNSNLDAVLADFGLTRVEREIAHALIAEDSLAAIAKQRGVKPSTIKSHVANIYDKTGTSGRIQFMSQFTLLGSIGV